MKTFFKRIASAFHTRVGSFVFFALAVTAFFLLRSASWAYGWIAELYFAAFIPMMFAILGTCVALLFAFMLLPARIKEKKPVSIIHTVACVLAGVCFVYCVVLAFSLDSGPSLDGFRSGWFHLQPYFLLLLLCIGLPFVFIIFPAFKKPARIVVALVLTVALALPFVLPHLRGEFAFSTNPLVIDGGEGYYHVVVATNRPSVAYLHVGDDVQPHAIAGRMQVGRIHNFVVPHEQLRGSSYHIVAREVLSREAGFADFGATLQGDSFTFRDVVYGELNILIASDWHNQPEDMIAAAANMPEPDVFVMIGDFASGLHSVEDIVRHVIWAGAQATGSVVPAIFARGNHETSGNYADMLVSALNLNRLYTQVRRGDVLFTVIDSADDWPIQRTSHEPFTRGSLNSENPAYLQQQLNWLASLEPGDELLHFAVVHIPTIDQECDDTKAQFFDEFTRLGVNMQLSGHWHGLAGMFFAANYEHVRFQLPHPVFFAGGPTQGYSGDIVVSMVRALADGSVHLLSYYSTDVQRQDMLESLAAQAPAVNDYAENDLPE
ncbi:MAG: metallophosphoesterase [Oscillospiraceae bacterium]|nr:metallophosphoesterase [Oscillospiraceae bacterium]